MKTYQLDNKETDKLFLKGENIYCPAAMSVTDLLDSGDRLVILLSNGKKYMGEVVQFDYTTRGDHAEGQLRIVRYSK